MKKRHAKWNIEYETVEMDKLIGMDANQALAIEQYIESLARQLAETSYLLSMHEMNAVPAELKNSWPSYDYREVAS